MMCKFFEANKVKDLMNNSCLLLTNEIWKEHPTLIGYYGSSLGRVKKCKGKNEICLQNFVQYTKGNYRLRFSCNGKQYYVNKFITECFLGMNPGYESDHINSIEYDNRIENLRWLTHSDNVANPTTNEKIKKNTKKGIELAKKEPNILSLFLQGVKEGKIDKTWAYAELAKYNL